MSGCWLCRIDINFTVLVIEGISGFKSAVFILDIIKFVILIYVSM